MLAALLTLVLAKPGPTIAQLDQLAQAKDIDGLDRYLEDVTAYAVSPFRIIKTGGGYDVGRFGWHAVPLKGVDGVDYVVIWTKMTSEDTGELLFRRDGDRLKFIPEADKFGVKLIHHDFDLRFDIPASKAILTDKLELTATEGGSFFFRMSPQYVVSSITSAGKAVPFAEASGVVSTVRPSGQATYEVQYQAVVDQPNFAGSVSSKEASLVNDYWYPMVGRQPSTYDIVVHGPPAWTTVAQGDLLEDRKDAKERVMRYRMDLPCVFFSVDCGPFKVFSQKINGRTYSCWSALMTRDQMEAQTEFYAPIIEFYSRFAPFPFSGYGAVDSQVYGGGALEAYSFTTWGHGSLPSEDAHEPSHTWWGGMVCNTYLSSFWNESFADFSDGLYHRNVPIGNVDERRLAFIQSGEGNLQYNVAPLERSGADVGPASGSLGYGKGAQVLQMLEQLLGTDQMVATMKAWLASAKGTAAEWPSFEAVAEQMNPDKHLESFFAGWMRKPGFADLRVSDVSFADGQVSLKVGFNGEPFRMPLDVMLQFADGSRRFVLLDVEKPDGTMTVASTQKPVLVSIDPWRRGLRKIAQDESPAQLSTMVGSLPRFIDAAHKDYLGGASSGTVGPPSDPAGKFIIGNPATMPILAGLCDKVGFRVSGDKLTYEGTTIDLNHGCAMAIVDLGGGKSCVIGMGKTRVAPDTGRARLVLTDDLGRFLRGRTEPKTEGPLTFRL